jgi:hypothetical protein
LRSFGDDLLVKDFVLEMLDTFEEESFLDRATPNLLLMSHGSYSPRE